MSLKRANFHSFLWLSSVPLYVCMCMYTYVCVSVCVYIYISHTFFIHSSVMDRMGWFHILAVVNNAAMNIGVHVSF